MASKTFEAKMPEKEDVKVNVLEYQPNFPMTFWMRTILMGIVLVPLRLFLIMTSAFVTWLCALFHIYTGNGCAKDLGYSMVEWMAFVTRLSLYSAGMVVSVEGVKSDDAPIVVVGPHTTFWDGWITVTAKPTPVMVIAFEFRQILFFGELLNHIIDHRLH